jgi:GNAT superfamily N-acetyltransferase
VSADRAEALMRMRESPVRHFAMFDLKIERVRSEALKWVVELFMSQVYPDDPERARRHFKDHAQGGAVTFLAFRTDEFAGYVTILWQSKNRLFQRENIPLIRDLFVFPAFQRRGVGSRLMDEAEALIATRATKAGITVGLFDAYGPAQRLYALRGYIPDGRGACRGRRPLKQGEAVTMDHDLFFWLTKDLSAKDQP